jgi:hypothetical protein
VFIRFRQTRRRLYASLVETKRVDGVVRQHHLAALSSVAIASDNRVRAVRERREVWTAFHEAVARLGIDTETAAKFMTTLHARIPYVTEEESGEAELLEAESDVAHWESLHHNTIETIKVRERVIKHQQDRIADDKQFAAQEAENIETAKQKVTRLGNYRRNDT